MTSYDLRDEVLLKMGFSSYKEYLGSDLWKAIRSRALSTKGNYCFRCGRFTCLVHHTNYSPEVLRGETLKGLVPVCTECHRAIEFDKDGNKRTLRETNDALGYKTSKKSHRRIAGKIHRPIIVPHHPHAARHRASMTDPGQPCRKCGTPVVKRIPKGKHKTRQNYAYRWYLRCPNCKTMFMVESAKYLIDPAEKEVNFLKRTGPGWCPICGNCKKKKNRACAKCLREKRVLDEVTAENEMDIANREHLRSISGAERNSNESRQAIGRAGP